MRLSCCKDKKLMKETRQAAGILKIIAEENRLRILCILKNGERCVCQIIDHLGLSQSLVSHHLKSLKDAELIQDSKRGLWVYYSLTDYGKRIANLNLK